MIIMISTLVCLSVSTCLHFFLYSLMCVCRYIYICVCESSMCDIVVHIHMYIQ